MEKKEKEKNAVIVGLAEAKNNQDTAANDQALVESICKSGGISFTGVIVRRLGRKGDLPRITKVYMQSGADRADFLRAFRQHRPATLAKTVFCRPDLTLEQRKADKEARDECRRLNEENKSRTGKEDNLYMVRNSKVILRPEN